jgi:putative inorganic carbon (HCO3(-)) transporter
VRLSLQLPADAPTAVRAGAGLYVAHLLCEGWINTSQGFLALSLLALLIAWKRGEIAPAWHRLYVPMAIFVAASWCSALLSPAPLKAFLEAHEYFNFMTLAVALALYARAPRFIDTALNTLATLAIFLSSYGLIQYFFLGRRELEHRITGTAAHVMTYSGLLLGLALFFLILAIDQKKLLWGAAAALSSLALVLTFTRGAWIGWVAGTAAFVLLRRARWVVVAGPLLLLLVVFSPLPIFGRLISSFDVSHPSNLDRIRMLQAGTQMVLDQPLFGVGPGNIKETYPLYRAPDAPRFKVPHLHNNLIQIWAERGAVALAAYLFMIAVFLWGAIKARRAVAPVTTFPDAGIAVAVGLAVAGLFEFNFGDSEVLLTMLDLFALSVAATARQLSPPDAIV